MITLRNFYEKEKKKTKKVKKEKSSSKIIKITNVKKQNSNDIWIQRVIMLIEALSEGLFKQQQRNESKQK